MMIFIRLKGCVGMYTSLCFGVNLVDPPARCRCCCLWCEVSRRASGWLLRETSICQFPSGQVMSFVPAFLFIKVVSRIVPPAVVGLMNLGLDMSVNACHDFQWWEIGSIPVSSGCQIRGKDPQFLVRTIPSFKLLPKGNGLALLGTMYYVV